MANEFQTWPLLGDFRKNIKRELLRRKNQTFGENNKPRAVWVRAISNAVDVELRQSGATVSGETTVTNDIRKDINVMVGGLLLSSGATRGGFEPVYQRVAKGRELRDRPMPGIESISVSSKGEYGSLRKITINWTCPSIEDLDILMPYWLSPGISVLVEWGWSNIGQLPVPIDITDTGKMAELYRFPAKIMNDVVLKTDSTKPNGAGAGNQDFFIGIITNFTWNMNEDGSFTCTTELTTFGETMLALNLNKDVKKEGVDTEKNKYSIREYVEKAFSEENLKNERDKLSGAGLDDRSIIKAFEAEGFTAVSFGAVVPTITHVPDAEGDIYVTWDFIEKRIINDHGCLIVGDDKGVDTFFAFQMDSSHTTVSNDGLLYSRDPEIIINNNNNSELMFFNEQPTNYNVSEFGVPDKIKDGFFKNVYVKRSLLVDTFNNSETLEEALQKLLNKIRAAAFDLWDLKIQTDALGESTSKVIDQKYVSKDGLKNINDLLSNDPNKENAIFNFGGYSGQSILRNVGFTSKMTNQIALTHFFGRNKDRIESDKVVYSNDSDIGIKAVYGAAVDRVLRELNFKTEAKLKEPPPEEEDDKPVEKGRLRPVGQTIVFKSGKTPTDKEIFVYRDENDIKLLDQYLRRQTNENKVKNIPIYPLEISVTIDGISGILPGNVFTLDNLPKAYKENGVFQVVEISHEISSDDWVTTLRAFFRPVNIFNSMGEDKAATGTRPEQEEEKEEQEFDAVNRSFV
jgi:hypothetical protein